MSLLLFCESHIEHLVERAKVVCSKADVEELKQFKAEYFEAIRETDKHTLIEKIANKFNLALWMKGKDSVFIFANKPCGNLILKSAEPTFKSNGDFDQDALAILCVQGDQAVMKKGKDMRFIESAVYPNRESVWLDIYKSPSYNPSGEICGTIGSGVDITKIVPDKIKEKYKIAQSLEIDISIVLSLDKIKEIVEKG